MNINININIFFANLLYAILSISGCYAAVIIPGYEYVGEGSCFGKNGGYHPSPLSVSATDTFDPNDGELNCAAYCNNFRSIGESFRGFDGGYYGCQCRFDEGVTEELLSPIYMSLDNEVNWVDQFSYLETGEITSSDGYSYDWEFNINKGFNYCYKVVPFESPPIDGEDTECVDTQGYTDQWGGLCVDYESNAAWCGGYGEMGESGLTPNENCCVCKPKLASSTSVVIVEDTTSVSSSCFNADDGGGNGVLYNAVRAYVSQDCANNENCEIGQTYGWPINSWCVENVKDMSYLFIGMDAFNEVINGWNTSSVTDMSYMFNYATSFNGDVSNFDTSRVTNMRWMFQGATSFNGDLSSFDTSSVANMYGMFWRATSFNQDLSNFDTSSVTNMAQMFYKATLFNGDVSNFNTSSVTDMNSMLSDASSFNQDLSNFDTSSVTDMSYMFSYATTFDGDVSKFDTSSVTDMSSMFSGASSYNRDLSNFDTSKVTNMRYMFYKAISFDGDVSNFDTSSVADMSYMFRDATAFNGDLCSWQDTFPYTTGNTYNIFTGSNGFDIFLDSGCTYQDTPQEAQNGPFCASDCQSSSVTPVPAGVPLSATSPPTAPSSQEAPPATDPLLTDVPASIDFVVSFSGLLSADEIMEGKTNQVKIMLEEQMLVLSDTVIKEEFWNSTEVESGRRLNNLGGKVVRNLIVKAAVLATLDDVQDVNCPDTSSSWLTDCLNFNNTIILQTVDQLDIEGTVEIFENAMLDKIEEGWLVENFDIGEALKPPLQETLENSEANTIEIKLKPYADLDWRNMILFEPYVPSPIVSASCSNKCPCSDCQCGIEMVCGGTIPIDLPSGNELKFVWEASSDNDKFISVTGTSQTRVEIRLTIQDCTAPYQLIHGSNVTIVIGGLDGIEQKYAYDPESSFVILGSKYGDICDVYTRMQFNPNENGVLDMKFTTLTFTAGYDNTKVTDETSYTWATDSYTWIRQPVEGGSIKLLDMLAGYSEEPWEVEETSPLSTSPTLTNVGIDDDQFCLEETKALQECGIYDIDNVVMAEACAFCQIEAMGEDIMSFNTDSFCNKWKACANEKCPADCITPMNALQVCMFQDTGMTVDCLSSPDNTNADIVESKAPRRQVITTAVMIMGICGVIFV